MSTTDDRHLQDHVSDPASTPGEGWVSEGGASHLGPATHVRSGRPEDEDDEEESDPLENDPFADDEEE